MKKLSNYWRRVLALLPPPPAIKYDYHTDRITGITYKIERPCRYTPFGF